MREFWESMASAFGPNVSLETPKTKAHDELPPKSNGSLEEQVQALLTEDMHLAIPDQTTASLNQLYLGMLTTICRYALSEIYLTREAVLISVQESSRGVVLYQSTPLHRHHTNVRPSSAHAFDRLHVGSLRTLLRTLVGILELLEAAAQTAQEPDVSPSRLEQWIQIASKSEITALPWQLDQLPLENALKADLPNDNVISTIFELVHTAIEGNLSTIDATGVSL